MKALAGGPRGPLIIAALALGALWLYSRRATVASVQQRGRLAYTTPTSVGEQFARGIVALTRGLATSAPAGVTAATAQEDFRRAEIVAQNAGSWWSAPSYSLVSAPNASQSWNDDGGISAGIYDLADQFAKNDLSLGY